MKFADVQTRVEKAMACEAICPRSYSHLYGLTPLPVETRVMVLLAAAALDAKADVVVLQPGEEQQ